MNIKIILYCFAIGSIFVYACSYSNEKNELVKNERENIETTKVRVVPTDLLTMEVQGMSCEMGCGAAIRRGLLDTKAVEGVTFDFKMGREINIAQISYDKKQISKEQITEIVSQINEKQFTAKEISNTTLTFSDKQ